MFQQKKVIAVVLQNWTSNLLGVCSPQNNVSMYITETSSLKYYTIPADLKTTTWQ